MAIKLFNTLSKQKETFIPQDPKKVTMYVCGPTVYSHPHIGNARAALIPDILYRLLLSYYPDDVVYIRKITDVDEVEMLATKWLIHRTKKGYESIVDIKIITKENKEAYKSAMDYKISQKQKELNKFLEKHKLERQKLIDELVDLEVKKENI